MTASGMGQSAPSQLLRGRPRANDAWHIYTAVYDGKSSELFVDGVREAGGKSVGSASLDGLRLGSDHTSTFFLNGAIAEVCESACLCRVGRVASAAIKPFIHPLPLSRRGGRCGSLPPTWASSRVRSSRRLWRFGTASHRYHGVRRNSP